MLHRYDYPMLVPSRLPSQSLHRGSFLSGWAGGRPTITALWAADLVERAAPAPTFPRHVKPGMGGQVKNCSREGGDRTGGRIFRAGD
jgi:hypothetical protein